MKQLTEEQIEAAAKAAYEVWHGMAYLSKCPWSENNAEFKERWYVRVRATVPFLQLPWEDITEVERSNWLSYLRRKAVYDVDWEDLGRLLNGFITDRNNKLLPKKPNPVVRQIAERLAGQVLSEDAAKTLHELITARTR
jgi:hypothetical protein